LILNTGCSTWKIRNSNPDQKNQGLSKQNNPGLFGSKPNTRQAQIDLAFVAAEQHEAKQEYRDAMSKYQEVLKADSKNAIAHHRLALIACRLAASKQAHDHFEAAMKITPKDTDLVADYAYWNYLNGQYPQASELVETGLKRNPESERLHGLKGLLLSREHQFEQAEHSFVLSGCTMQQAWANIGHILLLEGDVQTAAIWIERAAQGDQGSTVAKKTQSILQASFNEPTQPLESQQAGHQVQWATHME
jgi:Tfp pilus assembly protein PilF